MKNIIKCVNVDYSSSKIETFTDLQLDVKGKNNILESFRSFVEKVKLEGEK